MAQSCLRSEIQGSNSRVETHEPTVKSTVFVENQVQFPGYMMVQGYLSTTPTPGDLMPRHAYAIHTYTHADKYSNI